MDSSLQNALVTFLFTFLVIYAIKPSCLFEERTGRPRQFGLGYTRDQEKCTLFNLTIFTIILGIIYGSIF
jgi:hypothetical protein